MNGYFEQFSVAILGVIRSFDGELTLTFIEYEYLTVKALV